MPRIGWIAPAGIHRTLVAERLANAGHLVQSPEDLATASVDGFVVHAFHEQAQAWLERARENNVPSVLVCAPGSDAPLPKPGHSEAACSDRVRDMRADAYVWRASSIDGAVQYVLAEERDLRSKGPLRLVFLGHGGEDYTRAGAPPLGEAFELEGDGGEVLIGRPSQSRVTIRFTTSVARLHARVVQERGQAFVSDLGSTNGTYVEGSRIAGTPGARTPILPGQEIAVAGFLRLRLDGDESYRR